jgi:Flp pilus assembly protein TadD
MMRHEPPLKDACRAAHWDGRWRAPVLCLVLAAITFAVFGQTLHHEFVFYDDNAYVYKNPVVARGLTIQGIVWAFTSFYSENWHPLTWLSHMLDCQLYGLRPGGHHLTSVLLHTATVIALFLLLRQMTGALWRSAFVAAVFAIHPLRVESVAWVAERKDVLSGLFFMLTIGAYVRYARHPWSWARYGLVVLLFAMGLMCKPMLVTLPVVLLLLDYWPLNRWQAEDPGLRLAGWLVPRRVVFEKLPLLALSAASCVATLLAQVAAIRSNESFPPLLRIANGLATCVIYLGQMVYPAGLSPFYPYPHDGLPAWEVALAVMLLAGLSVVAWVKRRTQPWLLIGWAWYLVMLLPVVGVIQAGGQSHADRYTYLPQIGIYVAVAWLAAEWGARWRAGWGVFGGLMACVLAVLMVCAWRQTAYWKNSETLWIHALACTTGNAMAHNSLGLVYLERGDLDKAILCFQKALQIHSDYVDAHNNLGLAFMRKGQLDKAISCYQDALELQPYNPLIHYNLGCALIRKGRADEAIYQLQTSLGLNPDDAQVHDALGAALLLVGKVDEAIYQYQAALEINPNDADAKSNLGNALRQKKEADKNITHSQKTPEIKP